MSMKRDRIAVLHWRSTVARMVRANQINTWIFMSDMIAIVLLTVMTSEKSFQQLASKEFGWSPGFVEPANKPKA